MPVQLAALRLALDGLSAHVAGVSEALDATSRLMTDLERSEGQGATDSVYDAALDPVTQFDWESDAEGIICWVQGAPRATIVGHALPVPALSRGVLRGLKLHLSGCDALQGEWVLSATPLFDSSSGRFLGHRGEARRGERETRPAVPPDMVRQLVHEIRTPLNAIMGFAGMIDGEHLGPADPAHRARAAQIVRHAGRVLETVDALDEEARRASACQTGGASAIGCGPGEGL